MVIMFAVLGWFRLYIDQDLRQQWSRETMSVEQQNRSQSVINSTCLTRLMLVIQCDLDRWGHGWEWHCNFILTFSYVCFFNCCCLFLQMNQTNFSLFGKWCFNLRVALHRFTQLMLKRQSADGSGLTYLLVTCDVCLQIMRLQLFVKLC